MFMDLKWIRTSLNIPMMFLVEKHVSTILFWWFRNHPQVNLCGKLEELYTYGLCWESYRCFNGFPLEKTFFFSGNSPTSGSRKYNWRPSKITWIRVESTAPIPRDKTLLFPSLFYIYIYICIFSYVYFYMSMYTYIYIYVIICHICHISVKRLWNVSKKHKTAELFAFFKPWPCRPCQEKFTDPVTTTSVTLWVSELSSFSGQTWKPTRCRCNGWWLSLDSFDDSNVKSVELPWTSWDSS